MTTPNILFKTIGHITDAIVLNHGRFPEWHEVSPDEWEELTGMIDEPLYKVADGRLGLMICGVPVVARLEETI